MVGLSPSKTKLLFSFNQSSLKMMENASYLILKALLVLKIFKFFPDFFGHVETYGKRLIKTLRLISKFMTSQPRKQTITKHILLNMSRSFTSCKSNQTIKFGLLIEYNVRNIFLQNSCKK